MLKKLLFYLLCFLIPPNISDAYTQEQQQILEYVNKHCGVHKRDIAAIIIQESFVGDKVIRRGDSGAAHGVGQMHIPTAKYVLSFHDKSIPTPNLKRKLLTDDEFAVIMILRYYQYLLKTFNYNRKLAILAYNVGPTKVKRTGFSFDPNDYLAKVLSHRQIIIERGLV